MIDPFREKIEEWVELSRGRVRADVAQRKLEAMGYAGSERTTRRAIAEAKATYRAGHRRRFRPWLPEPGLWFQWDYADGPVVDARKTWLWVELVLMPSWPWVFRPQDHTLPSLLSARLWNWPALIALVLVPRLVTWSGVVLLVVELLPSSPSWPERRR